MCTKQSLIVRLQFDYWVLKKIMYIFILLPCHLIMQMTIWSVVLQMGVCVTIWTQLTLRRSNLRNQCHHGLNLCMEHNQTSFLTQKTGLSKTFCWSIWYLQQGSITKCLKLGKDIEKSEVEKLFRSSINMNGYWYNWPNDEKFIVEVESLWMISHQITQVCTHTWMIDKVEVWSFVYQRKGKDINWAIFASGWSKTNLK